MIIINIIVSIICSLMSAFAFNQVIKEQQKLLIIHGIVFFVIAVLNVYLFMSDYVKKDVRLVIPPCS